MKKFYMTMVAMLCGVAAMAQNELYAENFKIDAGSTTTNLEICMKNVDEVTALSFRLGLPEGVSMALNKRGKKYVTLDEDRIDDHTAIIQNASDGSDMISIYSASTSSFYGNDGAVISIPLTIAKDGKYKIHIYCVSIADPAGNSIATSEETTVTMTVGDENVNNQETDISKLNNVIYMEKNDVLIGSSATLSFRMKNKARIRGFQFDLFLPNGVTVVKKNNRIQGFLSKDRLPDDDEHTLTISQLSNGAIRFLCASQYDESFTGNEGEILTLQVNIANNLEGGDYPVDLKNMRLSETDISKHYDYEDIISILTLSPYFTGDINHDGDINVSDYIGVANYIMGNTPSGFVVDAADVDGDGDVNVSDYIGIANIILTGNPYGNTGHARPAYVKAESTDLSALDNVIYVEPMNVNAGKEATLSFMMKNTAAIRGFQFDLYLPEGVEVVVNNKGRIQGSLSSGRLPEDDEHTLTLQKQGDGAIRFLCGSQYDETFTGTEGEIATLQVTIADGMEKGKYPVILKTMRLTETDIDKYYVHDDVETEITVTGGVGIENLIESNSNQTFIYNLAGQRLTKLQQGINIVNGKKYIVK